MPDYDFHQLSPYDLEILSRDLLQAHWGITLESFKTGKDGGIDIRYADGSNKTIVQVKHFLRTGFKGLMRELKKEEGKIQRLRPGRYVVVTSVPLSAANKDAIVSAIGADVLKLADVIGQEDLNNLLGQYPAVEGKHYKLWLASRAVFDRVLRNAELTRSEFKAKQVHNDARRYVQSSAYPEAMKMLNEHRVVIIAGPPGVGKTTLANLLLYDHMGREFQVVLIQRDIEEGLKLFQAGTPQIFYFDDFMGATFLGDRQAAMTGSNDKAMLEFIAMVRSTPTARLVLTTREHIYELAMERSERLRLSDLNDLRVFLRMPSYSFAQKARILYNHLFFSDLPSEYQDELLRGDYYLRIIKHDKFNPRLIEWLSSYRRLRNVSVEQYLGFVENLLRDPSEIWRHAYEREITDAARSMLMVIFSMGGKSPGNILKLAFATLHRERAKRYDFITRPEDFRSALREVAGTFIRPFGNHGIEVIDPSVLDLLNATVRTIPENALDVISGAHNFEQLERIWAFATSESNKAVLEMLLQHIDRLAGSICTHMMKGRRVDFGDGNVGYRGSTFERRLVFVVEIADRLVSPAVAALITPLFERLQKEWQTETPNIVDAIYLLGVIENTRSVNKAQLDRITAIIKTGVIEEAKKGCRSDELREVIGVFDTSREDTDNASGDLLYSFEVYRTTRFQEELRDCRSREEYDGLSEDLSVFRDLLGVDVEPMLEKVSEAKLEFERYEEEYADHMQDEYKERWREERDSELNVSDMFESLRGDRNT